MTAKARAGSAQSRQVILADDQIFATNRVQKLLEKKLTNLCTHCFHYFPVMKTNILTCLRRKVQYKILRGEVVFLF